MITLTLTNGKQISIKTDKTVKEFLEEEAKEYAGLDRVAPGLWVDWKHVSAVEGPDD